MPWVWYAFCNVSVGKNLYLFCRTRITNPGWRGWWVLALVVDSCEFLPFRVLKCFRSYNCIFANTQESMQWYNCRQCQIMHLYNCKIFQIVQLNNWTIDGYKFCSNRPGVFTRVKCFVKWINDVQARHVSPNFAWKKIL